MYVGQIWDEYGGTVAQILKYTASTNSWTTLVSNGLSAPLSGTLEFDLAGSSLELSYNGQVVASVQDSSFTGPGGAGISSSNNGNSFTNFSAAADSYSQATGGLPFSDNFTRASDAALGDYWSTPSGDFILSNDAAVSTAGGSFATVNGISAANVDLTANISLNGGSIGLVARVTSTGMYVGKIWDDYGGPVAQIQMYSAATNSWTTLASNSTSGFTGTLEFSVTGSSLALYYNGQLVAAAEDSSITGAGGVGIYSDSNNSFTSFSAAADSFSPATAELPFSDNFNRSDSAALGDYWSVQTGDFALQGDQAVSVNNPPSLALVNGVSVQDVSVSATVNIDGIGFANASEGLMVRYSTSSGQMYLGQVSKSYGSYSAQILVGSINGWNTLVSNGISDPQGETLQFVVVGPYLGLYLNGTLVASIQDSSISSSGGVGIYASAGGGTFGDFAAAAAGPFSQTDASLPFTDNFNRSNSPFSGSNWSVSPGGDFVLNGNEALSTGNGGSLSLVNGISASDVSVSATVNIDGIGYAYADEGLVARELPSGEMYLGQISKAYSAYSAQILVGTPGNWSTLASAGLSSDPQGETLEFVVVGPTLDLYLNGTLVAATQDGTLSGAGSVGFYASAAGGTFGNFSVAAAGPYGQSSTNLPFNDNFDRPNSPFLGDDWTVTQGDFVISDDQALSYASSSNSLAMVNGTSGTDMSVSALVSLNDTGPFGWGGVAARVNGENGYVVRLRQDYTSQYVDLCLEQNGNFTTLDSQAVDVTSGTVELEVDGSTLLAYFNGALVGQATDTTFSSGGVGIAAYDSNITIGDFAAAADVAPTPENASLPFTDDFDRANSTYLGPYWTEQSGNFAISNNEAMAVTDNESTLMLNGLSASEIILQANIDLSNADIYGASTGLDARMTSDSGYRGEIYEQYGSYTAEILRDDDGTWTTIASGYSPTGTGTLRFELNGSSLDLYMNGAPVAMASDSTYSGPGDVGVDINSNSYYRNLAFTDFSAIAFPAPPSPQDATLPFSDNFTRDDSSSISAYWSVTQGNGAVGNDSLETLSSNQSEIVLNGISAANIDVVADVNMQTQGGTIGLDAARFGRQRIPG